MGAHPAALIGAFVLVHAWLIAGNLLLPGLPLGDVQLVYPFWASLGIAGEGWVGIDTAWVYPYPALLPMLAVYPFGQGLAGSLAWLLLMTALNALALVALAGVQRDVRRVAAAWWWLGFLTVLGPIALGRIDAVTAAVAVMAAAVLAEHPRWAGALIAAGAWVKVWPGALLLAALVAARRWVDVARGFVGVSVVVVAIGVLLGGGAALISPLTEQTGRGLQVESPLALPWMWAAGLGGDSVIAYDREILTWQVTGPGTAAMAALATPLLAVVVAVILALAGIARRRGVTEELLLPALALALVAALVTVNKVGSPQFATWLAAPIVLGILLRAHGGLRFRVPATLALAAALLTQVIYPVEYGAVLRTETWMLVVLTTRTLLYAALLVWALVALIRAARGRMVSDGGEDPAAASREVEGASP
ncbi:MAG: glycosyltransferase 87 family protein [Microcella sp.]